MNSFSSENAVQSTLRPGFGVDGELLVSVGKAQLRISGDGSNTLRVALLDPTKLPELLKHLPSPALLQTYLSQLWPYVQTAQLNVTFCVGPLPIMTVKHTDPMPALPTLLTGL